MVLLGVSGPEGPSVSTSSMPSQPRVAAEAWGPGGELHAVVCRQLLHFLAG